MRFSASASALLLSLACSAKAAFLLDFFSGKESCDEGACLRAVTSAPVPSASADCSSYLYQHHHDSSSPSVAVPIPTYASSLCQSHAAYNSACSCLGVTATAATPAKSGTTTTTVTVPYEAAETGYADADSDGGLVRKRTKLLNLDATLAIDALCQSAASAKAAAGAGSTETVALTVTVTETQTTTKTTNAVKAAVVGAPASTSMSATASVSASASAAQTAYPTTCLSDAEATAIAGALKQMLTDSDKSAVNETARDLLAGEFMGWSGSVNSLAGMSGDNVTYPDLASFLAFLALAPGIPELTTLDVFHDCSRIAWYWAAMGVGSGSGDAELRGIHLMYTVDGGLVGTSDGGEGDGKEEEYGGRKVNMVMFEFDSLGWAEVDGKEVCDAGAPCVS